MSNLPVVEHNYKVGDEVSFGFNGDWYHAGQVERVTKTKLTATNGMKFSLKVIEDRMKVVDADGYTDYVPCLREIFKSVNGGTWRLTPGIVEAQNPHF